MEPSLPQKSRRPHWQPEKVKSKKEVILEALKDTKKVHLVSLETHVISENAKLEPTFQKYKRSSRVSWRHRKRRFWPTFITQTIADNIVMWETRVSIVDWVIPRLRLCWRHLRLENQLQEVYCVFLEVEHSSPLVGCVRSKRQCSTFLQNLCTEHLTARTCFSVLSVFVVFCICLSVSQRPATFHMHMRACGSRTCRHDSVRNLRNSPSARHVTPEHLEPFFLLFDTSTDLDTFSSDADWNQTLTHALLWPSPLHAQVTSPTSASMSAVSTPRSISRPGKTLRVT